MKTLSSLATEEIAKIWNPQTWFHIPKYSFYHIMTVTTPTMKAEILKSLWKFGSIDAISDFIRNSNIFVDLFASECFKIIDFYKLHEDLDRRTEGAFLLFPFFNRQCTEKLYAQRLSLRQYSKFMSYAPAPLTYSLYLVNGGYYQEALEVLISLKHTVRHFLEKNAIPSKIRIDLNQMHIVILTAILQSYTALNDVKHAKEIYGKRTEILKFISDPQYYCFTHKAAAFLTECSKLCYLMGKLEESHAHVMQAAQLLQNHMHEKPHLAIVIETLRQASIICFDVGRRDVAKECIYAALALANHISGPDSIIYADCLQDYAQLLGKDNKLYLADNMMVLSQSVSITIIKSVLL